MREYTLVGNIDKDTVLNGTIDYYNKNGILVSKADFTNGVANGPSINYYLSGAKKNESRFFYGREIGNSYSFDSITGNISYKNYYYYGKLIGPNYTYYPNGKIQEFYFLNFEEENIFSSSYDSLGNVKNMTNAYFQMHVSDVMANDSKKSNLFLYNLQPPRFLFEYNVCVEDSNRKILYTLDSVQKEVVFIEKLLPEIPVGNKYCIVLNITDSAKNKKHTLIREILN
jgi:hypothetical protein